MVIRYSVFLAGTKPLPRCGGLPNLLADELDLIELQLYGRFASEHGYDHANLVLFDVEHIDDADEAGQRAVADLDIVALGIGDHDLVLFHAKLLDLFVGQRGGLGAGADKAGHAASERMTELLRERGVMTERLVPEMKDWNDDLLNAQKEELAPCLSL